MLLLAEGLIHLLKSLCKECLCRGSELKMGLHSVFWVRQSCGTAVAAHRWCTCGAHVGT